MSMNSCAVCGKDDAIRKVSAVVAAGQASGSYSGPSGGLAFVDGEVGLVGGYTSLSGRSSTDLARLLEPPTEPPKRKHGLGLGIRLAMSLVLWPVPFLIIAYILADPPSNSLQFWTFALGGLFVIFVILSLWANSRERKRYRIAHPLWEAAIRNWVRLYYCLRDDIVFDPDSGNTSSAATMDHLLLEDAGEREYLKSAM